MYLVFVHLEHHAPGRRYEIRIVAVCGYGNDEQNGDSAGHEKRALLCLFPLELGSLPALAGPDDYLLASLSRHAGSFIRSVEAKVRLRGYGDCRSLRER